MPNLPFSRTRRAFLQRAMALAAVPPHVFESVARGTLRDRDTGTPAAFEADVPALLQRFGVPGLAFELVENGKIARMNGFGVKHAGEPAPVSADTIFEAASLSKPPFAYLTLRLAEAGRIHLDTSIGTFFRQPDFVDDDRVDLITPRVVLSHRTGLANWRPAQQPMTFQFTPGTAFSYSGEAYVRLQRFVERTATRSLTTLAEDAEFTPWMMDHSSYLWREGFERIAAEGHDATGTVVRTRLWGFDPATSPVRPLPGVEPPPIFALPNAAASLYTSAHDYGRFLERLLSPPAADDVHVNASSIAAMFRPVAHVNDELSWGLGWGLARAAGTHTFWHWGNNNVYQSFVVGSRERRWGLVVLTNSASGLKVCREVVNRALGADHPAFAWNAVIPR